MQSQAYSVAAIVSRATKIQQNPKVLTYMGCVLEKTVFDNFVAVIAALLPGLTSDIVIRDSLLPLAGRELTWAELEQLSYRFAGNIARLRQGEPVLPWTRQPVDEWVPAQAITAKIGRNRYGRLGATLQFRILAGLASFHILEEFWTNKFCAFLGQKVGFSPPWGPYPYKHPYEFVNLRFNVMIDSGASGDVPKFTHVRANSTLQAWNRQMLKWRARVGFECFKGYTHPCHQCPIGYDQCAAAVHRRTFAKQVCGQCHERRWVDPENPATCVACATRMASAKVS